MMKKIVPDPPLPCTSTRPFGRCDAGHEPLFTVNPNISAEDALVHVALYLRGAYETGSKALEYLREEGRGMYWSSLHSIELAEGLVEAILDGIESIPNLWERVHPRTPAQPVPSTAVSSSRVNPLPQG
ncbi:DUF3077 domain-containing protein [Pseudomonas sp. CES]|uniref:DUF3077 domain-containing protein n=1 Tax=Pseudomonas sp. CES TaxID=2719586 RepID=UPI00179E9DCC|nr:DUF3077 domain-containing protein [Pseudomonas sp. CES]KAF4561373.1 hypothetical protein HBJ16_001089 [Pseudomonas sp. CES]